jgi:hypothetical protein
MTIGSGHVSPIDCALIALPTVSADVVGSPDSLVNFSRGVLSDSQEQRVRGCASLGTRHYPVHLQLVQVWLFQLDFFCSFGFGVTEFLALKQSCLAHKTND